MYLSVRKGAKMQKKGQVWIESVLYTLIGLAIIGLLLVVTRPKISQTQDEFIIQQTINALSNFDNKLTEIQIATGNRREIEFQLSKGELLIDPVNSRLQWSLKGSNFMYSEPGSQAQVGNIKVLTTKQGDTYDITLTLDYANRNKITVDGGTLSKTLTPVRVPYKIFVESTGKDTLTGLVKLDVSIS